MEAFQSDLAKIGVATFLHAFGAPPGTQVEFFVQTQFAVAQRVYWGLVFLIGPDSALSRKGVTFVRRTRSERASDRVTAIKLLSEARTKEDLLDVRAEGITIGDLLYDLYLWRYTQVTVTLTDPRLVDLLAELVGYARWWSTRLRGGSNTRAICVSHFVYQHAIPARVAAKFGISVFQVDGERVHKLDPADPYVSREFREYRAGFLTLTATDQDQARRLAQARIESRLNGSPGLDCEYLPHSPFSGPRANSTPARGLSRKTTVLVALHDFFDSPHVYGRFFYPDFSEWLEALGNVADTTDYRWLIRPHPAMRFSPGATLDAITEKHPGMEVVSPYLSHYEVLSLGVDVVTTVYGSIAVEYAALNVPVVVASKNVPYVGYSLCIVPEDRADYERVMRSAATAATYEANPDDIAEFYFMHYLNKGRSWLLEDYAGFIERAGGYEASRGRSAYRAAASVSRGRIPAVAADEIQKLISGSRISI